MINKHIEKQINNKCIEIKKVSDAKHLEYLVNGITDLWEELSNNQQEMEEDLAYYAYGS